MKIEAELTILESPELSAGERLRFGRIGLSVGRGLHNDLLLDDDSILRSHGRVEKRGEVWWWTGTGAALVDGERAPRELRDGSVIEVGPHRLRFGLRTSAPGFAPETGPALLPGLPQDADSLTDMEELNFLATTRFSLDSHTSGVTGLPPQNLLTAFRAVDDLLHIVDPVDLCRRLVEAARLLLKPETVQVMLLTDGVTTVHESWTSELVPLPPVSRTVRRHVMKKGESVLALDARGDERWRAAASVMNADVHSLMCVPLIRREERFGLIYVTTSTVAGGFRPEDLELLSSVGAGAALALSNAKLYERLQASLREQQELIESQSRFVPRQFLAALGRDTISDVRLGDHVRREMSVMFSDLRGFTPLAEQLGPRRTIALVNRYFSAMEPPIVDNHGFIDTFVGDAIMALFQGGAERAVRAAVDMFRVLDQLNASGELAVPLRMGVGINTGPLTLGTVGGQNRMKCDVIGDAVNLAARIESASKRYQARLLISEHTVHQLGDRRAFTLRQVDRVRVVGRQEPVGLFEVLDADPPVVAARKRATLPAFEQALRHYQAQDFARALEELDRCAAAAPGDRPVALFQERARRLRDEGVPAGWDGVENLRSK